MIHHIAVVVVAALLVPACGKSELTYERYNAEHFSIDVPKGWETLLDLNTSTSRFGQLRLKHDSKRMIDVSWGPSLWTFDETIAKARKDNTSKPALRFDVREGDGYDVLLRTERVEKRTIFFSANATIRCQGVDLELKVQSASMNQKGAETVVDHMSQSVSCTGK